MNNVIDLSVFRNLKLPIKLILFTYLVFLTDP